MKKPYNSSIHRRLYIKNHGSIPIDENGRFYEIHHIDGNHNNNNINNLQLVTIQEHYTIHYSQGDWAACLVMSKRMRITPEEKSLLASKHTQQRIANGTHPFLGKEKSSERARKRTAEGKNPFLGGRIQRESNKRRKEAGTHHLLKNTMAHDSIARGTHTSLIKWVCPHCSKSGKGGTNYERWHGDNCRALK